MSIVGFLNPTIAVIILGIGLLSGILSIIREVQIMYLPAHLDRGKTFWAWSRIAFVIAAVLLWADEHSKVSELQANALVISLNCEPTSLPIPFSPEGKLYLLTSTVQGGLGVITRGPKQDQYPVFQPTYRCSVINYGNVPLFSMKAPFNATSLEVVEDGKSRWHSGQVLASYPHEVEIVEVDGNGGRFAFYVQNGSDHYVEIEMPEYATFELANGSTRQKIRLRRSGIPEPHTIILEPVRASSSAVPLGRENNKDKRPSR
jgi:hypothetical protein